MKKIVFFSCVRCQILLKEEIVDREMMTKVTVTTWCTVVVETVTSKGIGYRSFSQLSTSSHTLCFLFE